MKKTNPKKVERKPAGSEIIRQCVIYVQAMAAYNAGFTADITDDFEYGGAGNQLGRKQLRQASRALRQLVAISPACIDNKAKTALTPAEMFAKASVLAVVLDQEGGQTRSLEAIETVYVRLFAREVEDAARALAVQS